MEFPKTAKELLAIVDEFLSLTGENKSSLEASKFWNIMSAVRGPDDEDQILKECTAAVIRGEAFPKTYVASPYYGQVRKNTPGYAKCRESFKEHDASHFMMHMSAAFKALGIDFYPPKKKED